MWVTRHSLVCTTTNYASMCSGFACHLTMVLIKNEGQWNIDCKLVNWVTIPRNDDFEYETVTDRESEPYHLLSSIIALATSAGPNPVVYLHLHERVYWLELSCFSAMSLTGHLDSVFQPLPAGREACNEAVFLWACIKRWHVATIFEKEQLLYAFYENASPWLPSLRIEGCYPPSLAHLQA